MVGLKPLFGLIRSIFPVLYFGGLLTYFFDVAGSVEQAKAMGLWPTLVGLAVVGLLFCIPLFFKLALLFVALATSRGHRNPPEHDDDGPGFDADAAIARYKAQQSAEAAPSRPASTGGRPTFGRKTR